ncbi:MAG: chemotaxis protein CheW [Nitrospirota bacterium]
MSVETIIGATQYLTFKLAEEVFAIQISKVREVLEYTPMTKVPRTPDFMRGVINLRGNVVPVIDLRLKFGMPPTERTINTCIIIMEVAVNDETLVIGALADSVQEVVEIDPEKIEPAPRIGTNLNIEFLEGMGKRDDDFVMILDIDEVFSGEEVAIVQKSSGENQTEKAE